MVLLLPFAHLQLASCKVRPYPFSDVTLTHRASRGMKLHPFSGPVMPSRQTRLISGCISNAFGPLATPLTNWSLRNHFCPSGSWLPTREQEAEWWPARVVADDLLMGGRGVTGYGRGEGGACVNHWKQEH